MKTINIIGAGSLGKVVGKTFASVKSLEIQYIVNSNFENTKKAVAFIGKGEALKELSELKEADIWMLSVPDDKIELICKNLVKLNLLRKDNFIFHCSGAYSSELLHSARNLGCFTASIHPMKSFANIDDAFKTIKNTYLCLEGDDKVVQFFENLFTEINIETFKLTSENKIFYHIGAVFACNYLTSLMECSLSCFEEAGLTRAMAKNIIEPFVIETLQNNLKYTTKEALTGPIKRGDFKLVDGHIKALENFNPELAKLYQLLVLQILKLSESDAKKA
jgi:predicted short-subunit dehydrogenase-like oxidoreductase (DUF2520 family)